MTFQKKTTQEWAVHKILQETFISETLFTFMMFIHRPLRGVNRTGFTLCKAVSYLFLCWAFLFQTTQSFPLSNPKKHTNNEAQFSATQNYISIATILELNINQDHSLYY